jgi:hypothetical protein
MDKFVVRTPKRKDSDESGVVPDVTGESEVQFLSSDGGSKKLRRDGSRKFNEEWEKEYFVIKVNEKPLCLICGLSFAENKKYNLRIHFNKSHGDFNNKYLLGSKNRGIEFSNLKSRHENQKEAIKRFLTAEEVVTLASYKVAFLLAQKKKPFSDAELVKECIIVTMCGVWLMSIY